MYEDAAISLQVLSIADKVSFVDYYGYYYRFNSESITNKRVSERNLFIFEKTKIMLEFTNENHPEALDIVKTICLNDNDYVMMECTRSNTEIARILFERLLEQNRDLSKNLGMRKLVYTNRLLLKIALKIMSKIYYNDFVRNIFKKVLGVNNG